MTDAVLATIDASGRVHECWFGRFEGPDHLYPNCPGLARAERWKDPWPQRTADIVDPLGGDLCGWCVRVWKARHKDTP